MSDKDPMQLGLVTYAWIVGLSMMGGFVSFMHKLRDGSVRAFNMTEFVGELCTSAFAGIITYYLCEYANFPPLLTGALVGVSGHMGNRALLLFERYLAEKFEKKDGP